MSIGKDNLKDISMTHLRANMNDMVNRVYFLKEKFKLRRYAKHLAVIISYEEWEEIVKRLEEKEVKDLE